MPNYVKVVPSIAIAFVSYEQVGSQASCQSVSGCPVELWVASGRTCCILQPLYVMCREHTVSHIPRQVSCQAASLSCEKSMACALCLSKAPGIQHNGVVEHLECVTEVSVFVYFQQVSCIMTVDRLSANSSPHHNLWCRMKPSFCNVEVLFCLTSNQCQVLLHACHCMSPGVLFSLQVKELLGVELRISS